MFIVKYGEFKESFRNLGKALRHCKMLTEKGITWELVDTSTLGGM